MLPVKEENHHHHNQPQEEEVKDISQSADKLKQLTKEIK